MSRNAIDYHEQKDRDDNAAAVREMPKLPRSAPRIDRLRWVVQHHQAARMEGILVDATTAAMLVKVHDALNGANQAKFLGVSIRRMVGIGWRCVK